MINPRLRCVCTPGSCNFRLSGLENASSGGGKKEVRERSTGENEGWSTMIYGNGTGPDICEVGAPPRRARSGVVIGRECARSTIVFGV